MSLALKLSIGVILLWLAMVVHGDPAIPQVVSHQPHPKSWVYAIRALPFNSGTNASYWVEITLTNFTGRLYWQDLINPLGTCYQVAQGPASGVYTQTNNVGTAWETPIPMPVENTFWCGCKSFLSITGSPPMASQFFRSYQTTDGAFASISDATNINGPWNSAYALIQTTNPTLSHTHNP